MWSDTVLIRNIMVVVSKQNAALLDNLPLREFSIWEALGCLLAYLVKGGGKDVLIAIPVTLSISRKSFWISLALHYWSVQAAGRCRLGSCCLVYHTNLLRLIYRVFCQTPTAC